MSFLFISRNNVHARYYKELIEKLPLNCKVHTMGVPRFGALKYIKNTTKYDFSKIIAEQLLRKQARNSLWHNPLIIKS